MNIHELKIRPEFFDAINEGIKTFEIRKNDRNYQVGDVLQLKEFTQNNCYTGDSTYVIVRYITDYAQQDNFVVMSIELVPNAFTKYIHMSVKEKAIFKTLITHKHLHGIAHMGRDEINTYWEMINILLDHYDISNTDEQWLMEFWDED